VLVAVFLQGDAYEAQQELYVRVAVEEDGDPGGAGAYADGGAVTELGEQAFDRRAGEVEVGGISGVEMDDLVSRRSEGLPNGALGRATYQVRPVLQESHGAMGRGHNHILAHTSPG
jgi:hypothetical protein